MSRPRILTPLAVLLLSSLALPLFAQDTADIALGGGLVARLRDRGAYATVQERAARADQRLTDVVSAKDTLHPQVSVKRVGNLWTVYAWDIAVLSVYPNEAKTNKMTEKQMADMWAKNLRTLLPKATPCSKLPPEMLGYKPAGKPAAGSKPATASTSAVTAKPAAAQPPVKPAGAAKPVASPKPVVTAAKPSAQPAPAARPNSTLTGGETGAMLLIVDALRTAREMNDQEWADQKEALAHGLYGDLGYYLTGKGVAPKLPAAPSAPAKVTAPTKPAAAPKPAVKPVTAAPKPAAAPKPPVKPVTATTKPVTAPTKPAAAAKPTAPKPAAAAKPTADASTLKVPQKNRIRAKFTAAKVPFDKLQADDPQAAAAVSTMLSDSRRAFAVGNFDEAERQVDAALAALGVEFKQ